MGIENIHLAIKDLYRYTKELFLSEVTKVAKTLSVTSATDALSKRSLFALKLIKN